MRHPDLQPLVEVAQQNIALLFSNYLNSLGILSDVQSLEHRFVIRVDDHQLDEAHQLFEEFIRQPHHPRYQQAAWQQGKTVTLSKPQGNASFVQQFLAHGGWLTLVVFIACWLVYILAHLGLGRDLFTLLRFYNVSDFSLIAEQPWRLIGPIFLHFSLLHIAFNTMWWWQLGGAIEKELGKGELLQLLVISAICSNVGQYLVTGPNFGGLSGVVYALVGFVWIAGWLAPQRGLILSKPIIGFLLIWLMLGFTDFMPINMANTAHLVGLISGCFLALWRFKVKAD
ncbi:rhomboid family intramembrane serine protease GlpG [Thalassotalea ganghwensis]